MHAGILRTKAILFTENLFSLSLFAALIFPRYFNSFSGVSWNSCRRRCDFPIWLGIFCLFPPIRRRAFEYASCGLIPIFRARRCRAFRTRPMRPSFRVLAAFTPS